MLTVVHQSVFCVYVYAHIVSVIITPGDDYFELFCNSQTAVAWLKQ